MAQRTTMAKSGSSKKTPAQSSAAASPTPARTWLKFPRITARGWILLSIFGALLLGGSAIFADYWIAVPETTKANFVGTQSCISCHQSQHEDWIGSHHDLAMDRATPDKVIGDFNDAKLEHYGITSTMFMRDGKYFINTEGPDGALADFEIKYVLGVDPLQQYMVEFDRSPDLKDDEVGRLQVLRVSWDTKKKKWFHLDPPDVAANLPPGDQLHWTGTAQRWNSMCADCHSTNLQKNFDVKTASYRTTWSDINVGCEACHGPGSVHIELASATSLFWDRKRGYGLSQLKSTSNIPEVEACAPCHSRRRTLASDYTAGCNYNDFFASEVLAETMYHADGQIEDEVYEYGSFVQSKMFHKGIRCSDCHLPHSGKLKHEGNKLCTSCHQHPAGKYDAFSHHHHPEGSAGASCVNCHMPETTYMAVDPRRDHSIRVPRPDLSLELGTPNACVSCHVSDPKVAASKLAKSKDSYAVLLAKSRDGESEIAAELTRLNDWSEKQLRKWYGPDRKQPEHYATVFGAARNLSPDAPKLLSELVMKNELPTIVRATATMELGNFVSQGSETITPLRKMLTDDRAEVRAAAIVALQQAPTEVQLGAITPMLKDSSRLVRTEAARILSTFSPQNFSGSERKLLATAMEEYRTAILTNSDSGGAHIMIGVLEENLGNEPAAIAAYETAIRLEPGSRGARANLASLLEQQAQGYAQELQNYLQQGGKPTAETTMMETKLRENLARARELRSTEHDLLERDAQLVPTVAVVQSRLGLSQHLEGWKKEAGNSLLTAHLLEPRAFDYGYYLAVFYRDSGRYREAIEMTDKVLQAWPDNPTLMQLRQELEASARMTAPRPVPSDSSSNSSSGSDAAKSE